MRYYFQVCLMALVLTYASAGPGVCSDVDLQEYALVMANNNKIKVLEYQIDLKSQTVWYRGKESELMVRFPLERLKQIVTYDPQAGIIPEDAAAVYTNPLHIGNSSEVDDGGIPILFEIKAMSAGSSMQ